MATLTQPPKPVLEKHVDFSAPLESTEYPRIEPKNGKKAAKDNTTAVIKSNSTGTGGDKVLSKNAKKVDRDREVARKIGNIVQQSLTQVEPVCKQITHLIDKVDSTPDDQVDEKKLVEDLKPLIEQGNRILQECNGGILGLDPEGRIVGRSRAGTHDDVTAEEYHLAGVLGLVGQLLRLMGLQGLVRGILGALGFSKIMDGLGLSSVAGLLGLARGKEEQGKEKKK